MNHASGEYVAEMKKKYGNGSYVSFINAIRPDDLEQLANLIEYCYKEFNPKGQIIEAHIQRNECSGVYEAVISYDPFGIKLTDSCTTICFPEQETEEQIRALAGPFESSLYICKSKAGKYVGMVIY